MLIKKAISAASVALSLTLSQATLAAENFYVCVVKNHYKLSDDGGLVHREAGYFNNSGKEFIVDRTTGNVTADFFAPDVGESRVLYKGDHENSFKSLITVRTHVSVLQVMSHVDGSLKPFVWLYAGLGDVYVGTCR